MRTKTQMMYIENVGDIFKIGNFCMVIDVTSHSTLKRFQDLRHYAENFDFLYDIMTY